MNKFYMPIGENLGSEDQGILLFSHNSHHKRYYGERINIYFQFILLVEHFLNFVVGKFPVKLAKRHQRKSVSR